MIFNTDRVKLLTSQRGIKQKEVARAIGIHPTAYSRILQTKQTSPETLQKIASYFNISVESLINIKSTNIEIDLSTENQLFNKPDFLHDLKSGGREMIVCNPKVILQIEKRILDKVTDLINGKMDDMRGEVKIAEKSIELANKVLETYTTEGHIQQKERDRHSG